MGEQHEPVAVGVEEATPEDLELVGHLGEGIARLLLPLEVPDDVVVEVTIVTVAGMFAELDRRDVAWARRVRQHMFMREIRDQIREVASERGFDVDRATERLIPPLSVEQAAQALGVRHVAVRRLIRAGKLRAVRVGRLIKIPRSALAEFQRRQQVPATAGTDSQEDAPR